MVSSYFRGLVRATVARIFDPSPMLAQSSHTQPPLPLDRAQGRTFQGFPLDSIICGLIERESFWNTYAIRSESESGFVARYGAAYADLVRKSAQKADDHWFRFEDIFYASYGLMQVMYPVALELGAEFRFPTELCDPEMGIEWGCRILRKKLEIAKSDIVKALLFYNGGGNKNYASEILALAKKYA